jgi:GT2 family glycosyltransferase
MTSFKPSSVSIVIPNYNGVALFKRHLPRVIAAAKGAEIIVVDDKSTDDSVSFLHEHFSQVVVVALGKNSRFAAACNAGVAKAHGEIILLLNSDVSPEEGFLAPLLESFADPTVFAVGCKEIQEFGESRQFAGRSGGNYLRGLYTHWRCDDQDGQDTLWVSGGSGAFRTSMWNQLGGMDVDFKPAYEEDRDLSYRALKRGWKVMHCSKSLVHHVHETTNVKALGQAQMSLAAHKNNLLFVWKNITEPTLWAQHLLWLPYHLVLTSVRTDGVFLKAFFWALQYVPSIYRSRQKEKAEAVVSDHEIIARYASIH